MKNQFMGLEIKETRMPMPDTHCMVSKGIEPPGMWKTIWFGPLDKLARATAGEGDVIWLTKAGIEALVKRYESQMVPL